jgi:hypothetical protein
MHVLTDIIRPSRHPIAFSILLINKEIIISDDTNAISIERINKLI